MQRRSLLIYVIAALAFMGLGAGIGVMGWIVFTGGTGEASEPITAPTLDLEAEPTISQEQAAAYATESAELRAEVEQLSTQVAGTGDDVEADADADQAEAPSEPGALTADEAAPARTLFRIQQDGSEARFYIEETMRGERITVVGTTDQVAGDVLVNFDNPAASQLGVIRINVRTLQTDESLRNQAIRGQILESARAEYEFSEFAPTGLEGLPESVEIGEAVEFQIVGDLTLRDVTRTLTFDATVSVAAEDRLEGVARTTILRDDFNVNIPRLPTFVADVGDEVVLEIEFVALAVDEEDA
jgi:polyisoprenoid-binding protein YceI